MLNWQLPAPAHTMSPHQPRYCARSLAQLYRHAACHMPAGQPSRARAAASATSWPAGRRSMRWTADRTRLLTAEDGAEGTRPCWHVRGIAEQVLRHPAHTWQRDLSPATAHKLCQPAPAVCMLQQPASRSTAPTRVLSNVKQRPPGSAAWQSVHCQAVRVFGRPGGDYGACADAQQLHRHRRCMQQCR